MAEEYDEAETEIAKERQRTANAAWALLLAAGVEAPGRPAEEEEEEVEYWEQKPLEGELVEISGVQDKLRPLDPPGESPVDVNGMRGCVVEWSEEEQCYRVLTFDNVLLSVPQANLVAYLPPVPEDEGGFDLAWPLLQFLDEFTENLASTFEEREYCVVQMFRSPADRANACWDANRLGGWKLPPREFEAAYLGRDNETKYAELETDDPGVKAADSLGEYDRFLTELGQVLSAAPARFGFELWGRTRGQVRVPFDRHSEVARLRPKAFVKEGNVEPFKHVDFTERAKVCMMFMIDNEGGAIKLFHKSTHYGNVTIPLSKGKVLLFRNDVFSHAYQPEGSNSVLLQAWLMTRPAFQDEGDVTAVALPSRLQGEQVCCSALALTYPGGSFSPLSHLRMSIAACDGQKTVPLERWDASELDEAGAYAYHGAFCEDSQVLQFHHGFFDIGLEEAKGMSVHQCAVLQTGYEVMERGGINETAWGMQCGVFVGASGSDETYLAPAKGPSRHGAIGHSSAVMGSRLSHLFGLKGPHAVLDAENASSMVAICNAHRELRNSQAPEDGFSEKEDLGRALVVGVSLLLSPWSYVRLCARRVLSPAGRTRTFDMSADGYLRGEGCGGILLKSSSNDDDIQEMLAALTGSSVNQNGDGASTRAAVQSQNECVRKSLAESGVDPSDVSFLECHGDGTAMGEAAEVSALHGVLSEAEAVLMTCTKSTIGHLEAGAGMGGFAKCLMNLLSACSLPNIHLRRLNPHIVANCPFLFCDELTDTRYKASVSGVSNFGSHGTHGHCDLWGRCLKGPRATYKVYTGKEAVRSGQSYERALFYGTPGPTADDRVYITGTWDDWSELQEMTCMSLGVYAVTVFVGETLTEQFHLVLNEDRQQAIHPDKSFAGRDAQVLGPATEGNAKRNWVIDGRNDKMPVGSLYTVTFKWSFSWECGEQKEVTWVATGTALSLKAVRSKHRHVYFVEGTWTTWQLQEMEYSEDTDGLWMSQLRVGMTGQEEFRFVCDRDKSLRVIHPGGPRTVKTSAPVLGPDNDGEGKHWLVRGEPGEIMTLQLRISAGEITVTVTSRAVSKTWSNRAVAITDLREYFITATWNRWRLSKMSLQPKEGGIYKAVMDIGEEGYEEFHIVVDRDRNQVLYPHKGGASLHEGRLCGPDSGGEGLHWYLEGDVGDTYEVLLNLDAEDPREKVSWRRSTGIGL